MQQQLAAQRSAQQQSYAAQQAEAGAGAQRARTSGSRPAGNGWKPIKVGALCTAGALLQMPCSRHCVWVGVLNTSPSVIAV